MSARALRRDSFRIRRRMTPSRFAEEQSVTTPHDLRSEGVDLGMHKGEANKAAVNRSPASEDNGWRRQPKANGSSAPLSRRGVHDRSDLVI